MYCIKLFFGVFLYICFLSFPVSMYLMHNMYEKGVPIILEEYHKKVFSKIPVLWPWHLNDIPQKLLGALFHYKNNEIRYDC